MRSLQFHSAATLGGITLDNYNYPLFPQSPAVDAVADFTSCRPLCVQGNAQADQARETMIQSHNSYQLVVDGSSKLVGIVELDDVCEQHVMQWVAAGLERHEVLVRYLMQPRSSLMTLKYHDLIGWGAADVAYALRRDGAHHCLILDDAGNRLQGTISAHDLAVRLGHKQEIPRAATFARLVSALHP